MPRANRNYRAEYSARMRARDELVAAGVDRKVATRVARGHPVRNEPTLRQLRASAKQRNESIGQSMLRAQRESQAKQKVGARAKSSTAFEYAGGTVLDTNSGRDALHMLEAAAGRGALVVVVGTRKCGRGVPVMGGRELSARSLLGALRDLIGGPVTARNIFGALAMLYPDKHDPPHPVVRVSITSVGEGRSAA